MATADFKDVPTERVYVKDPYDQATELVLKLRAMLYNCYGESGESFRNLHDDTQDNYLWACAGMADDLEKAIELMAKPVEVAHV